MNKNLKVVLHWKDEKCVRNLKKIRISCNKNEIKMYVIKKAHTNSAKFVISQAKHAQSIKGRRNKSFTYLRAAELNMKD